MTNTVAVSDASFQKDVLASDTPVLVDFWASWCGPCKQIAPYLEEIGGEMSGRLKIVKMNVDENPHTPQGFGVRSIPTMVIVKNGKLVAQKVGAVPKSALKAWIEQNI